MLSIIPWGVAACLATLVMVLILPVRLLLHVRSTPHWQVQVRVSILGGAIPAIGLFDTDEKKPNEKKQKKTAEQDGNRRFSGKRLGWTRAIPGLLTALWQALTVEHLKIKAVFGLHDPADTGALFGYLTPWIYSLPQTPRIQLDLQPEFTHACLTGDLDATVRITPIHLFPIALRFVRDLLAPRKEQW